MSELYGKPCVHGWPQANCPTCVPSVILGRDPGDEHDDDLTPPTQPRARRRALATTVPTLVPRIEIDRAVEAAMTTLRSEWQLNIDRAAIDAVRAIANGAAAASRRRFGFAMFCVALLLARAVYDHVYGRTNRERITRIERTLDEREARLERLERDRARTHD